MSKKIINVEEFATSLDRLCHKKGCPTPHKCPVGCGCDPRKLGLHTAIMWDVSSLLFYNIGRRVSLADKRNMLGLRNLAQDIFTHSYTAFLYHKDKFPVSFLENLDKILAMKKWKISE